jgi:positive regulator of sigma E activity
MYLIPLIVLIVLALVAMAWGAPIFALGIFALFFVGYLAWVGLSRRSDEQPSTPEARAAERGRQEEAETRIR